MSFTQAVPGMAPGSTIRNLIVAFLYLPFILFWPFIGAYVVARNRGGAAESLSAIPGIGEDGGIVAGVVAFVGILVAISIVMGALPGGDDITDDGTNIESTSDGVDSDAGDEMTDDGSTTDDADSSGGDEATDSTDDDPTDGGTDDGGTDDGSTSDGTDDGNTDDDSTSDGTDDGGTDDSSTSDGTDEGGTDDSSTSDGTDDGSAAADSTSDSTDDGSTDDDSTSDSADDGSTDGGSTEDDSPSPAPDGDSYSFSGSGNDVTDGFESDGGLVTIAFEHDGESNFQVQAVDSAGNQEYLVNEIGTYDGEVALYLPAGEWQFDVTADGSWSADVEQPRFNQDDIEDLPIEASDQHADWFGPIEFEGGEEVTFEIEDESQAAVWLTTHEGDEVDLLHNEIGPYEGSALVNNQGVGLIVVKTDSAEWRIEIER